MFRISNIPILVKLYRTIRRHGSRIGEIDAARESGDCGEERQKIGEIVNGWAEDAASILHLDIDVTGRENLPEKDGFVIISNHESYADILAIMIACRERQIGFVAKDSLQKVPCIGKWVAEDRGLFIQRGDARAAVETMKEGVELIHQGFNLAIFPEGTRSRCSEMGHFKAGSFRLATKAKAPIVPVAIHGTYHLYEETGRVRPAHATIEILPAFETAGLDRAALRSLEANVEEQIRAAVKRQADGDPRACFEGRKKK